MKLAKYHNVDICKEKILSDNQNKSGIYMFQNSINGKRYIGSAVNFRNRFQKYFNINHLLSNTCMYICRALLKHGYSNFSLTILEYCEPSKCLEREGFYLKKFKPEYNISQDPTAPMYGRTHSDATKKKIYDTKKGQPKIQGSGSPSQAIEVFDNKNNTITNYDSINEAARALNIKHTRIVMYFTNNQKKPYKGQYTFKKI